MFEATRFEGNISGSLLWLRSNWECCRRWIEKRANTILDYSGYERRWSHLADTIKNQSDLNQLRTDAQMLIMTSSIQLKSWISPQEISDNISKIVRIHTLCLNQIEKNGNVDPEALKESTHLISTYVEWLFVANIIDNDALFSWINDAFSEAFHLLWEDWIRDYNRLLKYLTIKNSH